MAEHDVETSAVEKQVDPKIVDDIAISDVKTTAGAPASAMALAAYNATANQQRQQDNSTASSARLQEIANVATGVLIKRLAELDPTESGAIKKVDEAGLARQLMELQTAIVAMGQNIAALIAK